MIKIINYDVGQADCLLIQFKNIKNDKTKYFNLLIDGAYVKNHVENIIERDLGTENLSGIVISHIDSDHISGILDMVKSKSEMIKKAFIIFNKYDETLISYEQAKQLAIEFKKNFKDNLLIRSYAKCYSEEDNSVINSRLDENNEIKVNIMSFSQRKKIEEVDPEIVNITMLGPSKTILQKFMRNWHDEKKNHKITNASSVVLLIEYDKKVLLMSGDGYFSEFETRLNEININEINVIKASHHGAKENNKKLFEIAEKYKCKKILFTISGKEDKKHPDLLLVQDLSKKFELCCSASITDLELGKLMIVENEIII